MLDNQFAYLTFTSGVNDTRGDVFFDKIALSAIPEPATFAMLTLGAALMIRRRR